MFKIETFIFFDSYPDRLNYPANFYDHLILAMVPFINLLYLIGCLHSCLFYKMTYYKKLDYFNYVDYEINMRSVKKHNCVFEIVIILDCLGSFF